MPYWLQRKVEIWRSSILADRQHRTLWSQVWTKSHESNWL